MPLPKNKLENEYRIHVGKKGTFFPDPNPLYNSSPEEIDELFRYLEKNKKTKLLLYFHGGLVSAEDGLSSASKIVSNLTEDSDVHPICFIWKTDLKRTIIENLDTISTSAIFRKILIKALLLAGDELEIEPLNNIGTARGSDNLSEEEIIAELAKEIPFADYTRGVGAKSASGTAVTTEMTSYHEKMLQRKLEAKFKRAFEKDTEFKNIISKDLPEEEKHLMNPEYIDSTDDDGKGFITFAILLNGAVKIALRVIKRFWGGTDHDFHPTVVEETIREIFLADTGNWAWNNMKNKAAEMWSEDNFTTESQSWHVGYYFIYKLNEFQKRSKKKLTIDLVGHSAGSIAICNLLKLISEKQFEITFRKIFFLAPACRSDLFDRLILSNQHLFSSFRCFTMKDELEKKDQVYYNVYPYSLLYLISGILEDESDAHILGLQRHSSRKYPYDTDVLKRVSDFLIIEGNAVYSETDINADAGLRCTAKAHGGFSEDPETLKCIKYLINQ